MILDVIKPYIVYLILFFTLLFIIKQMINIVTREFQARWHKRWTERREKKQEDKKQKELEKQQLQHRIVHANNWLLNNITKTRIIIFDGVAGAGKTLLMWVFTKFLLDRFEYNDRKNRRYNQLMNPTYLERRDKLKKDGYLPLHTNLENIVDPNTGLIAQENVMEILTQQLKSITPAVATVDEIGSILPKSDIMKVRFEKDAHQRLLNTELKEFGRKLRHYGLWLLGTEQDGDDILKDIRQFGYASITALKTSVEIVKRGLRKQKRQLFFQKWAPGLFVSKYRSRLKECLFVSDRIKAVFKLLLPAYFVFERQFYINRNKIYSDIKEKYTVFKTLLKFEGKMYWLHFTNKQKLNYNTTAFRAEYDEKFNADGTRKATA